MFVLALRLLGRARGLGLRLRAGRGLGGRRHRLAAHSQQIHEDLGIGDPTETVLGRADHAGELAEHRLAFEDDGVQQRRLDVVFADLEALGVATGAFRDRGDGLDRGVDFPGLGRGVGVGLGDPQFDDAALGCKHVHRCFSFNSPFSA